MLEFSSSISGVVDSRRAVAARLADAMGAKPECDFIILYTTRGYDFSDIVSEARRLAPCAQVVGRPCSSLRAPAIMATKGPSEEFAVVYRGGELTTLGGRNRSSIDHEKG